MIIAIEDLNAPQKGVTANAGVICGGTTPNTVAAHASARIDMRFVHPQDYDELSQKLRAIASSTPVPGVKAELTLRSSRPPMPATPENKALFAAVQNIAESLGMTLTDEFRQGVSDANTIAQAGTPVLDGMGPIGAKDHSDREFMVKKSLAERAILLACVINDCWDDQMGQ